MTKDDKIVFNADIEDDIGNSFPADVTLTLEEIKQRLSIAGYAVIKKK